MVGFFRWESRRCGSGYGTIFRLPWRYRNAVPPKCLCQTIRLIGVVIHYTTNFKLLACLRCHDLGPLQYYNWNSKELKEVKEYLPRLVDLWKRRPYFPPKHQLIFNGLVCLTARTILLVFPWSLIEDPQDCSSSRNPFMQQHFNGVPLCYSSVNIVYKTDRVSVAWNNSLILVTYLSFTLATFSKFVCNSRLMIKIIFLYLCSRSVL
jgi:hypothetical protein